jgi:hypothetical protein
LAATAAAAATAICNANPYQSNGVNEYFPISSIDKNCLVFVEAILAFHASYCGCNLCRLQINSSI